MRLSPAADDVLQFDASATVTNVPTETIGRLVLSNASVTLQAGLADNELTVTAPSLTGLDVPSGCTLTTGSPRLKLTVGPFVTASIGGTLVVGAAFTNYKTTNVDGTLQFNSGGSWTGNPPAYGASSLLIYGSGGTFGRGDEWSAGSSGYPANVQISNNTTLDMGANGGAATPRQMSGNLTIEVGSMLGMLRPGHWMTAYLQVLGNVTLGGTLELGDGPNWNQEGGSIRVGGNWTNTGGTVLPGPESTGPCRRVTFNGSGPQTITAPAGETFPTLGIDKTSGTLELENNLALTTNWPADALIMNAGDLDLKGHTLSKNAWRQGNFRVDNGAHSIISSTGSGTVLLRDGSGMPVIGSGALTFGETVTIIAYAGINPVASTTINGTLESRVGGLEQAGGVPPNYGPNSILRYRIEGSEAHAQLEWSGTGPTAPANVHITTAPGNTAHIYLTQWSWQADVTQHIVRNTLTIDPGCTLLKSGHLPLNAEGSVVISGGLTLLDVGGMTVGGDWIKTGTFVPNGYKVLFNGLAPQTITGPTTFDSLTVSNPAGLLLNDDITVNQGLTFTSGNITTGAKKVAVDAAGSISRTSGYVVGNLQMGVGVGTGRSKTFVIGDASNYTPVDVAFDAVTTAGNLTAWTTPGDHPQLESSAIVPSMSVNRYWTLTNGGVGFDHCDATFNFRPGDPDPDTSPNDFVVGRYDGAWSYPTVGTKTGTSTQATGLTSFSDFALGEPLPPPACFAEPVQFGTGSRPQSVAIGDLNGDGKPDLAVANWGSNTVSVLLGNGDGTFGAATDFGTGDFPYSVAVGDLNGDGKPDLAVANYYSSTVSVLLGNGDGTFGAKSDYGTGPALRSVAIGDLSGDGKPDLVTADFVFPGTVSVLLGDGDGTFGAATDFGTGDWPHSVAIGDLNGDGKPDLATANRQALTVSVLLGNGDGTFGAATDFGAGDYPTSVAIGDLNRDGKLDLATANNIGNTVSVLLGHGNGAFGAKTDYGTGSYPHSVAIGDLNGDGKPDLATANSIGNTGSILLGNGDGTFGAKSDLSPGSCFVAIGDLNGDGEPDLVTRDLADNTVSVLLNCTGTTAVSPTPPAPPRIFQFLASRPNPSRGPSEIHFLLPATCTADVALFDLAGRRVRSLASGELSTPGEHTIHWDGRDASGAPVHSGVYFVKVRAGRDVGVKRLIVLR
jgi:hypothetical protein